MKHAILYISYDGALEPLAQSQVLAYQERLARDFTLYLVSFEKPTDYADDAARSRIATRLRNAGIHWHPCRYHKRPSAISTGFDISVGIAAGLWFVLRHKVRVIHARSYVPAVMALVLKQLTGVKFLFDMRGFWADERVDGGIWRRDGRLYAIAKWFERHFLLNADHVISLTHAAESDMRSFPYLSERVPPITVIPTCADLSRFRPPQQRRDSNSLTVGYVGSAGTWYQFDAVATTFALLLKERPDARLLVINRSEHDVVRDCLSRSNVPMDSVDIRSVDHSEVPAQIAQMDFALFFIKPLFSKRASAPTKLAEFLGCGIPCLTNSGVGDMGAILEEEGVGISVSDFSPASLLSGLRRMLELTTIPGMSERCVRAAHRHFSLNVGTERYAAVYRELTQSSQ